MKSLRHFSTISVLAICAVFAIGQDSGLGRGRGGGGNSGGGSPRSAPPSTPPSSPPAAPRSSPPPSTKEAPRSAPPAAPAQDRSRGGGTTTSGSQDRSRGGGSSSGGTSTSSGSQDRSRGGGTSSGGSQDRSRGGGTTSGGSSRDSGSGSSGGNSQDSGLGRGGGTRDSGSGSSRDRTGSGSSTGTSRDRGTTYSPSTEIGRTRGGVMPDNTGLGRSRAGDGSLTRGRAPQERSQSGDVRYGSNNNISRAQNPVRFGSPQVGPGIIRTDSITSRAYRQDFPGFNSNVLVQNGWRNGYCSYWNNWNDNFFWYPNYCFQPFNNFNVVISPWYQYSFLPGYLNCDRVFVTRWNSWGWNSGVVYIWNDGGDFGWNNNQNRWNRSDQSVDAAVEDVRDTFERFDRRALDRLVPNTGQIAIMRDGRYDYSLGAQDFYDLMNDLASNAETKRYRIDEIRTSRDSMRIAATHEYIDPWGNRQRVYHMYYLERERGGYVIREFGTSDRRNW